MTREEKIAEARRLREQGLTVSAVAAKLGVARATVGDWVNPNYYSECPGCGGKKLSKYPHCAACRDMDRFSRTDQLGQRVESWWAEGITLREIARRLGWAETSNAGVLIDRLRARGYNLPYRHKGRVKGRAYPEQRVAA